VAADVLRVRTRSAEEISGTLIYAELEHSFRFEVGSPALLNELAADAGLTSLALGTLQIEVAVATGRMLFVWGLHPKARWIVDAIGRPEAAPGMVELSNAQQLQAGVSRQIAETDGLITSFDPVTGWVRVTWAPLNSTDEEWVRIASGTCLGLRGDQLTSVWLQPIWD
jgi:hypothetical protein